MLYVLHYKKQKQTGGLQKQDSGGKLCARLLGAGCAQWPHVYTVGLNEAKGSLILDDPRRQ